MSADNLNVTEMASPGQALFPSAFSILSMSMRKEPLLPTRLATRRTTPPHYLPWRLEWPDTVGACGCFPGVRWCPEAPGGAGPAREPWSKQVRGGRWLKPLTPGPAPQSRLRFLPQTGRKGGSPAALVSSSGPVARMGAGTPPQRRKGQWGQPCVEGSALCGWKQGLCSP